MTDTQDPIKQRLRELERSFTGFERGERNRLYESRDSLVGLAEAVEGSGFDTLTPLCEMSGRLLGLVLMEGGLDEARSVHFVRELLGYIEAQLQVLRGATDAAPGGVFHVVNSEKVGEILMRRGLIAPDQLEKALLLQRVSKGKRVGEVLLAMNAIDQRTLSAVLENQKGDTRRAETRGTSSTLGRRSIHLTPLPPVPGPSSAPTLPAPSPAAPVPFAPPANPAGPPAGYPAANPAAYPTGPPPAAQPYPAPLALPDQVPPMALPGQPQPPSPHSMYPAGGPPQPGAQQPGIYPQGAYPQNAYPDGSAPAAPNPVNAPTPGGYPAPAPPASIPFTPPPGPGPLPAPGRDRPGPPFDQPEGH